MVWIPVTASVDKKKKYDFDKMNCYIRGREVLRAYKQNFITLCDF